jgi:hypothetical protein
MMTGKGLRTPSLVGGFAQSHLDDLVINLQMNASSGEGTAISLPRSGSGIPSLAVGCAGYAGLVFPDDDHFPGECWWEGL